MGMTKGVRACCGASAVAILAGVMVACAGVIVVLAATYDGQALDHTTWVCAAAVVCAGFGVVFLAMLGCACAACANGPTTLNSEDTEVLDMIPTEDEE